MKDSVTASAAQLDAYKKVYFVNARYPQPFNGREVFEDTPGGHQAGVWPGNRQQEMNLRATCFKFTRRSLKSPST